MSDDIPILNIYAEDKEAEALRYADEVERWHAAKAGRTCDYEGCDEPVSFGGPCSFHAVSEIDWEEHLAEAQRALQEKPKRWFKWPCDRRDAHHPHPEDGCPGVGAHPLTQIGGHYKEEEIEK